MKNKAVEYFDIGLNFSHSKRYEKAIEFFTKAIESDDLYSEAFEQRAAVHLEMKNYDLFFADNKIAISLDSQNHGAYFSLFNYYLDKKNYEAAQDEVLKCLEISPGNDTYELNLSLIYRRMRLWDKVLEITDKILKKYPDDFTALSDRGFAFLNKNEFLNALKIFEILAPRAAYKNHYRQNLGFCLLKLERYEESILVFDGILSYQQHYAYVYNNRGFAKHKLHKNKEALIDINKSLEIDSSNSYAYKNRAIVLLEEDKKKAAKNDLLMAKELGYAEFYDTEVDELLRQYFS